MWPHCFLWKEMDANVIYPLSDSNTSDGLRIYMDKKGLTDCSYMSFLYSIYISIEEKLCQLYAQLAKVKIMKSPGHWEDLNVPHRDLTRPYVDDGLLEVVGFRDAWHGLVLLAPNGHGTRLAQAHRIQFEFHKGAADHTFMRIDGEPWKQPLPADAEKRKRKNEGDQAILATMEVDLTSGSQMIYVIPQIMMTIGDFYRNIQISILTRGYEAWQNSEANLLITRGLVGRLSNTHNVGFAYEIHGLVDYLTSPRVNALPGRSFSTRSLQGLNWVINPTQISIPLQPSEVNSQTMMDGRISLSFSNYATAHPSEQPIYNNKDEEILAILIEIKPGAFTNFEGTVDEYYEEYGDIDDYIEIGKQIIDQDERYSSTPEPHVLVNKISQHATLPQRQTEGSAGLDISASHAAIIEPYGRDLIHTGLRIEIPYGYYGRLASRSGLACKSGIEVGVGVIDFDYRGDKGFGSTDKPNTVPEPAQNKASTSQQPRHFTTNDIFSLLMPRETAAVLVQDDSIQNNSEQDQAATTSLWASVPRSLDPRQTEGSAGLDISASHAAIIKPYGRDLVHTGLRIEIPYGYYGRLASHSGLAWKSEIEVGARVIDSDYRGDKGFGSTDKPNTVPEPTQNKASTSQQPHHFTTNDIFSLPIPRETAAVLVNMLATRDCISKSISDPSTPMSHHGDEDGSENSDDEWEGGRKKFGAAETFKISEDMDISHLS
ncbi:hypothetical protein ZIOFF_018215 [Zingiber officinale]|uniref:dUTP diphosphatase n=1 Tax=Zingiber officinale TaxID=94328 RepID=A0A8J5H7X6_ZINOF|nr:hypothetical protein ZIOFF_018215 [Zingiber officinale]